MEKITVELENITPLFITGADQRNIENEGLRAPSLRGLLRWWFRAIMGGMVTVSDLKELESKIFGSINQKSAVKVLSTTEGQPAEIKIPQNLEYLWFSIQMQKRKSQREQCYPPKTKFKVILSSRDENSLKIALGCLWTLIYLGGVGARMRRGAGSLKVNNVSSKTPYEFVFNGTSVNEAKKFIEDNLEKIFKIFKENADGKFNPQKKLNFAVLSHAKISLISKQSNKWESILGGVAREYQQFRQMKSLKNRYTFGLPIVTRSKSKEEDKLKELRQASPLLIGVMHLNGPYTLRIVKFYTSIHHSFSHQLKLLIQDLDNFDKAITKNKNLGEVEVKIPEVK